LQYVAVKVFGRAVRAREKLKATDFPAEAVPA
jgi:hypothetical protein